MSYYAPYRQNPPSQAPLDSNSVVLVIRQQPLQACSTPDQKEKGRKAVDPPPIVQLEVKNRDDQWLVSPFLFMNALLVSAEQENGVHKPIKGKQLLGQTISSLHRLKDITNKDGGFFIFGDISCRHAGKFRLQFNLFDYEKDSGQVAFIGSTASEPFEVCAPKDFHGLMESTHLSRTFSDQGVRLRLRKEARTMTGSKRRLASTGGETAPSSAYAMYGSQAQSQDATAAYGASGFKRQRSDSEYSGSIYNSMQMAGNAMGGYHQNLQGSSGNWATRQHPTMTQENTAPFGNLIGSQDRSVSMQPWHGNMQQGPYSAPIRDSSGSQYFGMGAPASRSAYAVQQPQQYQHRRTDDPYSNLSLHTSTSLPDAGLGSHQQYSMRGGGDAYAANRGLQTPSSMADDGSRHQQVFQHSADNLARQDESGGMAQDAEFSHGLQGAHGQVGMRPTPTHATIHGYQSGIPAPAGSHTHPYSMQHPASQPTQYDQGQFNAQDLFHGSRDAYLPNTASMPDDSLTLDSGVLNRGYHSQFLGHQHAPDSAGGEEDLSEFGKAQRFFPEPRAENKCLDCGANERLCSKELPRCSECKSRGIQCIYPPAEEKHHPPPKGGTARQYIVKRRRNSSA